MTHRVESRAEQRTRVPLSAALEEPSPTDAELVRAIAAGDHEALAELYDRHHDFVFRMALGSLRRREAALDVLSEVMIAVWMNACTFAGRAAPRAWITGITVRKIEDQRRRDARHPLASGAAQEALQFKPGPDAAMPVGRAIRWKRRALEHCLAGLCFSHRQVIHLVFYAELSYGEISEVLGIGEGAARLRAFQARARLRSCLQGKGVRP
jgi:RNA polymerase sigma-70 factor (ECF subfamily)